MWTLPIYRTLWAAFPVVLVVVAALPLSARELRHFVERYEVAVTPETRPLMIRSILRARTVRLLGAAIGLSVHPLLLAAGVGFPSIGALLGLTGYLMGQVAAATIAVPARSALRQASLTPRRADDYLSRSRLATPGVAVVVSAVALLVYALEPLLRQPRTTGSSMAIVVVVVAAAAMYGAVRLVVRRPQPATSPALVAVDDAIRAQSIHGIAAAVVAFVWGISAWGFRTAPWLVDRTVSA